MKDAHKTVKIEGDDLIHITNPKTITSILCQIPKQKNVTRVDKNPTCPECINICLNQLNRIKSNMSGIRVISEAYRQIFGIKACREGKCDKLHKEIYKSSHNYPYIPNNCADIADCLEKAFYHITKERNITTNRDSRPQLRFLDAGCGIGNIVALANVIGFIAHGIELNGEYLKIARKLTMCMNRKPYFECANIITFNRYHRYDLVYYYVPIQDSILQTAFEVHLIRGMKVGAYMLPTGSRRVVDLATNEGYFKKHKLNSFNRVLFEKIEEVPKDWISKAKWLRKGYKEYVTSIKAEKGGKN